MSNYEDIWLVDAASVGSNVNAFCGWEYTNDKELLADFRPKAANCVRDGSLD